MSDRQRLAWMWLSWLVLAALIYYPAAGLRPYFDDTIHIEMAVGFNPLYSDSTHFLRPLQRALIDFDWRWSGADFIASKIVAVILLLSRTALVYGLARRAMTRASSLGSGLGPAIVSWAFLVHPIVVSTVGKIDNNTEALCSTLALGLVYTALSHTTETRRLVLMGAMVFVGLATKESFVGTALAVPVLIWFSREDRDTRTVRAAAIIVIGALASYFLVRWFAGKITSDPVPKSRYQLHFGLNVIQNVVASVGAMLLPGSTLDVFVKFRPLNVLWSAMLLGVVLIERIRRGLCLSTPAQRLFLIAMVAGMFPVVLLNGWPSEHHLASAMPFLLLTIACPLVDAPRLSRGTIGVAMLLLVWMGGNAWTKTVAERATSDRGEAIGRAIMAAFDRSPITPVQLCVVEDSTPKYGQFSIPDHFLAEHQLYRFRVEHPGVKLETPIEVRPADTPSPACTLIARGLTVTSR